MKFELHVYRGTPGHQYWEKYSLEAPTTSYNVISALMEIQKNAVKQPIVWEMGCLEEVCGSCTMLVNGRPRQACTALIREIIEKTGSTTIQIAPLTKYPLVKDLIVDRSSMFEGLKKAHAWVDVDSSKPPEHAIPIKQEAQEVRYALSTCMTCGCCTEACPQVGEHSPFLGPAVVSQVRLFNDHPIGKFQRSVRLQTMMEEGGIQNCGNAQNCVRVCPKKIPLTDSIAAIFRDTVQESLRRLFSFPDRS